MIKKIDADDAPEEIVLDGFDRDMLKAAQHTRLKIVEWYRKRLDQPVPQLGNYIEGPNARPWVRGDLLAAEMVRQSKDVPEQGPERENVILRYLLEMSEPKTWGSTPEYFAAACMTGKTIHVRQMGTDGKLFIVNSVNGSSVAQPPILDVAPPQPDLGATSASQDAESTIPAPHELADCIDNSSDAALEAAGISKIQESAEMDADLYSVGCDCGSIEFSDDDEDEESEQENDGAYNLFFRGNHYQALVTRDQYLRLIAHYGIDAFRNFRAI